MFSGVIAGRNEEVGEDTQLVLSQFLFVLGPVILVGSLEVLKDILDGGRYWRGVMQVVGEDHQNVRQVGRDIVGTGVNEGTEAKDG